MPNYVERVVFPEDDYKKKIQPKAEKYGLPQAILFTSKPKTTALLKYLSTEFRRRLLLVQVPPTTKTNKFMEEEFGILATQEGALPALIVVHPDGTRTKYDGKDFTRRKLERFLNEHALKEPVYKPVVVQQEQGETSSDKEKEEEESATKEQAKETSESSADETKKEKVHVEL